MIPIKDKLITNESLSAVFNYIKDKLNTKFDKPTDNIIPIESGGIGSSDGAEGLKNLFESGMTILSSHQYGDTLPEAGNVGRIFFKKIDE